MDDRRLYRLLRQPKSMLFDDDGMPMMHDGKPVMGWTFFEGGRRCFIPDMGTLTPPPNR